MHSNVIPEDGAKAFLSFRVIGIIDQIIVFMEAIAKKQKRKESLFFMGTECSFEDDDIRSLLKPLELELQKTVHTYCGKIYKIFVKQLAKSIRDRFDRPPKER
ncbi:hypothetical protein HPG69_015216 [Diceros bicornis minor]|uniref:Uncharacterized protein n=1 Tax=Diceros bicornis minor TaxID=77932 RepID=A0A7J7FKP0_DICBM|nr:hypothetical protein HPG69_015216 [Diceros bicornis minor]